MDPVHNSEILPAAGILSHLGERSRTQLTHLGIKTLLAPEEGLIHEGQKQDFLFILLSGSLEVSTAASGVKVRLGELHPYDCFGEMGMLEGSPACATVSAIEASVVWSLNVSQLDEFLQQNQLAAAHMLYAIAITLSRRLREANEAIRKHNVPIPPVAVRQHGEPKPIRFEPEDKAGHVFSIFKSGPKEYPKAKITSRIKLG
jgi:CRP/FNR family transcriptional regulator, cyclic AMP receptor protein